VAGSVPSAKGGTSALAEHWNGKVWLDVSPQTAATSGQFALSNLVPDGCGGILATSTSVVAPRSSFMHYADGTWTAIPAHRGWWSAQLAAVPHSTSTWAITGFVEGRGLILLHGPVPR
jgi:hypothetical protein